VKYLNFIVISVLLTLYLLFFIEPTGFVYTPIGSHTIFCTGTSTSTQVNPPEFSITPEKTRLPEFNVYTSLPAPDKFIANVITSRTNADFILVTETMLAQQMVLPKQTNLPPDTQKKEQEVKPSAKPLLKILTQKPAKPVEPPKPAPKTALPAPLTSQSLARYLKDNDKTYFYNDLKSGKDILLSVISKTPFEDKTIIKFRLSNPTPTYFFISSVSLADTAANPIPANMFVDTFVQPDSDCTGFAVLKYTGNLVLTVYESGGKQRCINVSFSLK